VSRPLVGRSHVMRWAALVTIGVALTLSACGLVQRDDRAVFVLVDVSGTYFAELGDAVRGSKLIAADMDAGDRLVVAEIGSCSFDDDNVALDARFPDRPSEASAVKRTALAELDAFESRARRSQNTDIHGAMLQAVDRLSRIEAGHAVIVIYSDLVEDPVAGCASAEAPLDLTGITVIAANVIKLPSDAREPARYFERLASWEAKVTDAGGTWVLVDDAQALRAAVTGG